MESALAAANSTDAVLCRLLPLLLPQATFTSARGVPRHPTKPGVTAVRCVPILPDLEAWPNKYVVVQFPEDDPKDSRTLAKVREVWIFSVLVAVACYTVAACAPCVLLCYCWTVRHSSV